MRTEYWFLEGLMDGTYYSSIESFTKGASAWTNYGNLPENKYFADAVVVDGVAM